MRPALRRRDPGLLARVDRGIDGVRQDLGRYAAGAGYRPYSALTSADKDRLQARLGALSEDLSLLPAALGVGS